MSELGQTNDPKALVPGDVGAVAGTMWQLRTYGDSLREAGAGLQRIDTTDGWKGAAADAFRKVYHGQPAKWVQAGDCFHVAADALDSYASTLQWAQGQASDAIRLWNEGQAATAQAWAEHDQAVAQAQQEANARTAAGMPTAPPQIPFADPGAARRQELDCQRDEEMTQIMADGPDQEERSLEQIEQDFWGEAPANATTLIRTAHELRRKPVRALTAEDIRLLISQQMGVEVVMQRAIGLLRKDPLVEGGYYPGDLLVAVMKLPSSYWDGHPGSSRRCRRSPGLLKTPTPNCKTTSTVSSPAPCISPRALGSGF